MEFDKLRLLGFKSFVEPTEFSIKAGLTGVVGPNGCGKSNLVEALRWVMGENSYKNMRASAMDDVIFSGSGNRPSRNMAEVALFLNNDDRTAPAAFNDAEELQVSRRIEREAGSVYRINGKDVRAKDVQLLFADVSTGARSPSMIGQGRIGELISAKPQARRALLEEAAGISGLHSRRHEAELRLRGAETNLERSDDVIAQLETQLESLKRQARQANRYRNLAGDIRRAEASILHLRWTAASEAFQQAESAMSDAAVKVGESQIVQTEAARIQAIIASKLPALRDAEVAAAAALQRVTISRDQLDDEARRAERRARDLVGRIKQLEDDIEREEKMVAENSDIISHLEREEKLLTEQTGGNAGREVELKAALETAKGSLSESETALGEKTQELAALRARIQQNVNRTRDGERRLNNAREQAQTVENDLAAIVSKISEESQVQAATAEVDRLQRESEKAALARDEAERQAETAREADQAARQPLVEAQAELNRIETEARTLSKMLNAGGKDLFPAALDQIKVAAGYERALGAAFGEDVDAPLDASAPSYWSDDNRVSGADPALPEGSQSLLEHVDAPEALHRRLSQTGIVEAAEGALLADGLATGQVLVSREGDIWRWDGFRAGAEAPTSAAIKLEQRNRLAELDKQAVEATVAVREKKEKSDAAKIEAEQARETERDSRNTARVSIEQLEAARRALSQAERAIGDLSNRRSALEEAQSRLATNLFEAEEELKTARTDEAATPQPAELEREVTDISTKTAHERAAFAELRAEFEALARENAMRLDRLTAIGRERASWNDRALNADRQIATLRKRLEETAAQREKVEAAPDDIAVRRIKIISKIKDADTARKTAADALAQTENELREADRAASLALQALSDAKQLSARGEERLEAARERKAEIATRIREDMECHPHEVLTKAGVENADKLPDREQLEKRLEKYKGERERLGAVNLRAEEEQNEIAEQRDTLAFERDELIEAIRQLRTGISSLNKEGRERLLTAFDQVNAQFQTLFTTLFGGGTAELQLVESDDPLEAGLEILARPPGKKPQTMTLLSGGEQALTAMALIFAVFLTNPAPICVLDEVDAPLDDHNVERFCNLMDEMSKNTNTRFVIITHNPITMARMDRLFGVTMAERGVSQLVSVDLQTAESFQEAG
ncbi:chromosome segregation protein SMC [Ahrensia sp. R2A130]|uniref:chromosome segregation protein SMC n=1 Tax=Ahrensia sp. R2A130 TaxID=744979 RepID=UPI0001E0D879|nr:chromosome segregation protein SMC [Ahrensia sp. R2A130]EFL88905.1 chromosome segregation protein SMC [Ahrensia sp. R2A130]